MSFHYSQETLAYIIDTQGEVLHDSMPISFKNPLAYSSLPIDFREIDIFQGPSLIKFIKGSKGIYCLPVANTVVDLAISPAYLPYNTNSNDILKWKTKFSDVKDIFLSDAIIQPLVDDVYHSLLHEKSAQEVFNIWLESRAQTARQEWMGRQLQTRTDEFALEITEKFINKDISSIDKDRFIKHYHNKIATMQDLVLLTEHQDVNLFKKSLDRMDDIWKQVKNYRKNHFKNNTTSIDFAEMNNSIKDLFKKSIQEGLLPISKVSNLENMQLTTQEDIELLLKQYKLLEDVVLTR